MIKKLCLMFTIITVCFITTNCKKDNNTANVGLKSCTFLIKNTTPNFKSTNADTITCSTLTPYYVKYKIDNDTTWKTITLTDTLGGYYYTNSIMLPVGSHVLNEFIVYSYNGTILMAAPHSGSPFAQYAQILLPLTFNIDEDKKNEVDVDVLCYQPTNYSKFGFVYFQLNQIIVHNLYFQGDFCIKNKADYSGSLYTQQTGWNQSGPDVPAIFKLKFILNGIVQDTFMNSSQGEHLKVYYSDKQNVQDNYEVRLYIYVKQGTNFNYVYFYSWFFNDISTIPVGSDNVTRFVLGDCYDQSNPPQLILGPYMNLPQTSGYTITGWNPPMLGGYVDATLSNIPNGYDIINGTFASNCCDHNALIYVGQYYSMHVFNSTYPATLPLWAQSTKWDKINWLYNHLDLYPNYHWYDIQGVLWMWDNPAWTGEQENGFPNVGITPMMTQMYNDANANGIGYKVPTGGWVTIIFIADLNGPNVQTMFIRRDP